MGRYLSNIRSRHGLYIVLSFQYQFSPGYFTDLWFFLTTEVRIYTLLWVYFLFEFFYIALFAGLLWICGGLEAGAAPGEAAASDSLAFKHHVIESARAVTSLANWGQSSYDFLRDDSTASVLTDEIV